MSASDGSNGPGARPGEIVIYGVLLLIALYAFVEAGSFAPEGARWPRSLALILAIAVITERVAVAIGARRERTRATDSVPKAQDQIEDASAWISMVVAGAFFLFILLAYGIGFLLATPLFTIGFMLWRGFHRRPLLLAAIPFGLTVTIYVMFGRIISTPLTDGAWLSYDLPGWL